MKKAKQSCINFSPGLFFLALLINNASLAKTKDLPPSEETQESTSKRIAKSDPIPRYLGIAVNFDDIANFSHYVNRAKLNPIALKNLRSPNHSASDFRILAQHYGHHLSFHTFRIMDWRKTRFDNFSVEHITSHSVNARKAHWSNFVISGSISNWQFQNARLENGWFMTWMANCNFKGAHLRNISFYGAKLGRTHNLFKLGKSNNFDNAILEDVSFSGSALRHATFKGAVFRSNVKFENANVHFVQQFIGARFLDKAGKEHLITKEVATKLDEGLKPVSSGIDIITSDEIVKNVIDHE